MKNKPGDAVQSRLKKKSPWFNSITDPMHGADCKIPDETGIQTGTFQIVERHLVETSAAGSCGFRVVTPYLNRVPVEYGGTDTVGFNLQITRQGTQDNGIILWGSQSPVGVWTADTGSAFKGTEDFVDYIDEARIVSAAIYVQPEPSLTNNKGEYCLYSVPFGISEQEINTSGLTYDMFANLYKSVSIPLNKNQPGVVRWYPFAKEDMSFKAFYPVDSNQLRGGDPTPSEVPCWEMGMVASGCEEEISFRITVVVNYEFVPKYNSMNFIQSSPSPSDATETDLVENWTQDMAVASIVPSKQVESSPSTVPIQHGDNDEGTGFGMFFNVIKELAPLALALI